MRGQGARKKRSNGGNMYNFELRNFRQPLWGNSAISEKEMERLFNTFIQTETSFNPLCEVKDLEKFFMISVDIPGVCKEDVNLEVKGDQLYLTGERKSPVQSKDDSYFKTEKSYGKFSRNFILPQNIKTDAIEAKFNNGVLEITLPKEEKSQTRKIVISEWKDSSLKN
jgi:HSP20 family protein